MSFKAISEVVELAISEASLFEKIGNEASQGDWIDTGMDAVQLGIDVARRLLPVHELDNPIDLPGSTALATELIARLTSSLHQAMHDDGHLTIRTILEALEKVRKAPPLVK